MFCSSCGAAVSPGLSYCNRCGVELTANERGATKRSEASQESLVWALACVTIVGIGAIIGLMAVMKNVVQFNNDLILGLSLLTFLTFIGIDSVIIWLLLSPGVDARRMRRRQRQLTTNELNSKARELPEPSFAVTEHTTHTLEPSDRKRSTE